MSEALPRFETIIERHHDEIYRYIWRMLSSSGCASPDQEAEDMVQEVFIRAYRAYRRLKPDSNVRAWLYKIATNRTYTALTQQQRQQSRTQALDDALLAVLPDDAPTQLEQLTQADTLVLIKYAILELPPRQRSALIMRYLQELTYVEIAGVMSCTEETARANVSHAIRRLRRELGKEGAA